MEKIKVIHDVTAHTLTVWFADPKTEYICEETTEEVVMMKNKKGDVIGFEMLNYLTKDKSQGLLVETLVHS